MIIIVTARSRAMHDANNVPKAFTSGVHYYVKELKALKHKLPGIKANELTYRAAFDALLKTFFESFAASPDGEKLQSISEGTRIITPSEIIADNATDDTTPKSQAIHVDYEILTEDGNLIGLIEAKDLGLNLKYKPETKQIEKYRKLCGNILMTNYGEFVWLQPNNGEPQSDDSCRGRVTLLHSEDLAPEHQNSSASEESIGQLYRLLCQFVGEGATPPKSIDAIASRMAQNARQTYLNLRRIALNEIHDNLSNTPLRNLYSDFQSIYFSVDIPEGIKLKVTGDYDNFLSSYAQMLTYGIFAAKLNLGDQPTVLEQNNIIDHIPGNISLVKKLFSTIATLTSDNAPANQRLRVSLAKTIKMMNTLDADMVHRDLTFDLEKYKEARKKGEFLEESYTYLFEKFLTQFDPDLKQARGAYYTPFEAVSFIVSITDYLLENTLGEQGGLAGDGVRLLDFATGTGTFLQEAIRQTLAKQSNPSRKQAFVRNNILNNFHGFELMFAPFIIAHTRLTELLRSECGFVFEGDERLKIYLGNTLSDASPGSVSRNYLGDEVKATDGIKNRHNPIKVIMGNPPYLRYSKNKGKDIMELMKDYTKDLGEERGTGSINDDYVKFIRFAHNHIAQGSSGIVSVITNHTYATSSIFRQMRRALLADFHEIYVLNLHGNNRVTSKHSGGADENIFNIEVGVAILFLVKKEGQPTSDDTGGNCTVYYSEMYGTKKEKLASLYPEAVFTSRGVSVGEQLFKLAKWKKADPKEANQYTFATEDPEVRKQYNTGINLGKIFKEAIPGVKTSRDSLSIAYTKKELQHRLKRFISMTVDEVHKKLNIKGSEHWSVQDAQNDIEKHGVDHIETIMYRPFDPRKIYYRREKGNKIVHRPGLEVMKHMLEIEGNVGLALPRLPRGAKENALVVEGLIEHVLDIKSSNYKLYPLYVTAETDPTSKSSAALASGDKVSITSTALSFDTHGEGATSSIVPNFCRDPHRNTPDLGVYAGYFITEELHSLYGILPKINEINPRSAMGDLPELVIDYIYGMLNHGSYLDDFYDLYQTDLPKVLLPKSLNTFISIAALGRTIRKLHTANPATFIQPLTSIKHYAAGSANQQDAQSNTIDPTNAVAHIANIVGGSTSKGKKITPPQQNHQQKHATTHHDTKGEKLYTSFAHVVTFVGDCSLEVINSGKQGVYYDAESMTVFYHQAKGKFNENALKKYRKAMKDLVTEIKGLTLESYYRMYINEELPEYRSMFDQRVNDAVTACFDDMHSDDNDAAPPFAGFFGVAPEVWEYTVGNYAVLAQYLKYRGGSGKNKNTARALSAKEIEHFSGVAGILTHTIAIRNVLSATPLDFLT